MKPTLSSLVELIGAACVLTAAFATSWKLGVALLGVVLVVVAYLADREEEPEQ